MADRLHNTVQTYITTRTGLSITVRNLVGIVSIPVHSERGRTVPQEREINVRKRSNLQCKLRKIKLV